MLISYGRKFWRQELVRLKYHNPAVPMTIDRTVDNSEPATMSIHFAPADAPQTSSSATSSPAPTSSTTHASPASDHAPTEKVQTVDMTHRTNSEILQELIKLTKAYIIEPTAEDTEELRSLEEQRLRSARDSKESQEVRAKQRREQEILQQARGDIAGAAA